MKDPRVLVLHALECIARVERFTAAGESDFLASDLIQGAVLHNLQTMAQSIMQLPDPLKASHRERMVQNHKRRRSRLQTGDLGVPRPRCLAR